MGSWAIFGVHKSFYHRMGSDEFAESGALLGMKKGCPGKEDLGEVGTAVVLLSLDPPAGSRPLAQAQQLSPGAWSQSALLSPASAGFRGAGWAGRSNLCLEEACGSEGHL